MHRVRQRVVDCINARIGEQRIVRSMRKGNVPRDGEFLRRLHLPRTDGDGSPSPRRLQSRGELAGDIAGPEDAPTQFAAHSWLTPISRGILHERAKSRRFWYAPAAVPLVIQWQQIP